MYVYVSPLLKEQQTIYLYASEAWRMISLPLKLDKTIYSCSLYIHVVSCLMVLCTCN